ncbi:MAG: phosphoenolpyruvate synthase [Candidatus Berkelbacteria bacterium]
MASKNILWFRDVDKDDVDIVGGKGANLGELTKAGLPVPPGFIVTAKAYFDFIKQTELDKQIKNLLKKLDPENSKKLHEVALKIQKLILSKPVPAALGKEITKAYQELYLKGSGNIFVAVRSSATAEDLPTASFAGQQKTFLNIAGSTEVVRAVRKCWASLYEPRAIYYRMVNKFDHMKVGIAVPVQKMIQSEKSGIMFTIDPITNDPNRLVIEAGLGLGEAIVSGSITPDRYVVSKDKLEILEKKINKQAWKIVRAGQGNEHVTLKKLEQEAQKITDEEILAIAKIGQEIDAHYGVPQDTEWAIEGKNLYFVQSRPVTTVKSQKAESNSTSQDKAEILLKGIAASLGIASGKVKILHKPSDISKIEKGDILVAEMTTPDFVSAMKKAVAIVTDTGGQTSHAAIVSRELGIPCVVGTGTATHVLKENQIVSVDGAKGLVYKGKVVRHEISTLHDQAISGPNSGSFNIEVPVTATKVYVNLGEPSEAQRVAQLPCDGVGLMRAEFMVAQIGEHPRALVKAGKSEVYIQKLTDGLRETCAAFLPRPVIYRATDFKTNEYRNLKGGAEFEPEEGNPMIGYRGASRYIKEPDLFKLELEAIKRTREKYDLKNLWIMIPFVRTVEEMKSVMAMIDESGLRQSHDFKIWMMAEVPSNVILMERFCALGIDGVSIGSNDLTQLTLGIDRDSSIIAEDFDERDDAVKLSIAHIIKTCRCHHVTVSICGQAATTYPEIAELMVKEGATSVSVSPDSVISTRRLIASIEKKILLSKIVD